MNLKNTTLIIVGIILIALLFAITPYVKPLPSKAPSATSGQVPSPRDGWSRYTDVSGSWTIDTASTTNVIVDKQTMASIGYIPTCDPTTAVICISIDKNMIPNSNFQEAAVSVNIISATSSFACLSSNSGNQTESGITIINAIPFQTFTVGDAAMSHQSSGIDYRTWHNEACYDLRTRINTTSFDVYEAGTVKKFTETDKARITTLQSDTVSTFRFIP
ncbi:hypothetical protein K2Q02_00285 [Patescibacteria group bacterium]|nr:hypothetical protein [Patescibacteria group bacterium]